MAEIVNITLSGTIPSIPIDLYGKTIVRIRVSPEWTTADLNFLEAYEADDTYQPLLDQNADLVAIPVIAGTMIAVDPRQFQSSRRIKVVSSASQDGARVLRVTVVNLAELVYTGGGLSGAVA